MDFYAADHGLRDLLALYVPVDVRATLEPHWARLGKLAGGRLDELARIVPFCMHAIDTAAMRTGSNTIPPIARWRR